MKQLRGAVEAVFRSWNGARAIAYRVRERISHDLGTAVNVQTMVFGNRDDNSGTGVGFTRNAATGEDKPYGDFLVNAQGEDVVAGIRNTEDLDAMKRHFPVIHDELLAIFDRLERHYEDMCDTEFTIEQGKLWMLQTRVGKRTGAAALRMAVDMTKGSGKGKDRWKISKEEALHARHRRPPRLRAAPAVRRHRRRHRQGPGRLAGRGRRQGLLHRRRRRGRGQGRREGHPRHQRDEPRGRPRDDGRRGHPHRPRRARQPRRRRRPRLGHARPSSAPSRCASTASRSPPTASPSTRATTSSLDGSSGTVVLGQMALENAEPPKEFEIILGWADAVRSKGKRPMGVRANADTGEDATKARELGAEGIGLCRTEHMFLAPDRLPVVRRMILARTDQEETEALEELRKVQQDDFTAILDAMDGLPVTVRLLDPPLHEFLPSVEELRIKEVTTGLDDEEKAAARGGRELVGAQPDDRHPRRAPRRDQAGPLRDAGAGAARRRRRPAQAGQEPDRRDHDPAHGDPRGAAPGPLVGPGRDRSGHSRTCARSRTSRSAR